MDFFDRQEAARRISGRLALLFLVAVLGMIVICYLLAALILQEGFGVGYLNGQAGKEPSFWNATLFNLVATGVLLVVGGLAALRIRELRDGGHRIAELLGGRKLTKSTATFEEGRLLNVVEEMAIASGVPVPPVYLLDDESGINGFAAGHTVDDVVIAVTRGSLEKLDRDELQGLVAHEFGHLISGDIRLNLRLVGLLYGIMGLGMMGWLAYNGRFPFAFLRRGAAHRDSGGSTAGTPGFPPLMMMAFALMVVGAIGTYFGKLIKAAVARQREFLADASALQLTRNPAGIGGALRKAAFQHGSSLAKGHGVEIGHMLFSEGFGGLYASHPPLVERLRRVDDRLLHEPLSAPARTPSAGASASPQATARASADPPARTAASEGVDERQPGLLEHLGSPTPAHVAYAREMLAMVPQPLEAASRASTTAQALLYALLLDPTPAVRSRQLEALANGAAPGVLEDVQRLSADVAALDRRLHLPLVEKSLPALDGMSEAESDAFRRNLHALVQADQHVSLFEWAMMRVVAHHLDRHDRPARIRPRRRTLRGLVTPCSAVLSTLAHHGSSDASAAQTAFDAGASALDVAGVRMLPAHEAQPARLDDALEALEGLAPAELRRLLTACALTISADGQVITEEAELFRAIATSLDCPAPPLLPGQPLAHSAGPSRSSQNAH